MSEPYELTVAEAADRIRRRRLSAVELMESLLARSRALDPDLRVWVTLDEDSALAEARRRQDELEKIGPAGPLHGVPVGVKDIFYTEGVRTTSGSPIYADFVPTYDATAVAALKASGAVIMGKTVTTEFACMDPSPTRNPWNVAHTPGGSSSGSAVGVAARAFPAALGSQTAGSVLRPAAYNGVVGMKPTFGRVSTHGVTPVAGSLDTVGFFTRTVRDAATVLGVLAGHDLNDLSSSSAVPADYSVALDADLMPPHIGLVGQLFHDRADPEVRVHTEDVVRRLARIGAKVDEIELPADFDAVLAAHRTIMAVEAASVHEATFKERADDYGPNVRGLIEAGMATQATTYAHSRRVQRRFRRDVERAIADFDVLLTPSTTAPAPRGLDSTGDPAFQTPWTFGGFPAITVPSGLSNSGLPLGVQLVSARFAEVSLLGAAQWCEQALDVRLAPPV